MKTKELNAGIQTMGLLLFIIMLFTKMNNKFIILPLTFVILAVVFYYSSLQLIVFTKKEKEKLGREINRYSYELKNLKKAYKEYHSFVVNPTITKQLEREYLLYLNSLKLYVKYYKNDKMSNIPYCDYFYNKYLKTIQDEINNMLKSKERILKLIDFEKVNFERKERDRQKHEQQQKTNVKINSNLTFAIKAFNTSLSELKNMTEKEFKKKFYLPLVKKHHPDCGGSKENFQKIQNCMDIISTNFKKGTFQ